MDRSIPAGAAILLAFIFKTEVSRPSPECYNVIYGHNQFLLPKPLTQMTVREVQAAQASWSKRFGSSATGAYQFMRSTLEELVVELKILPSQKFDGDFQDRLGFHLLKRRGYLEFMAGKISRTEFGKRISMEWASFPVLAQTKGAHRSVARGQSYYAGDGLNKSLTLPATVEGILDQVKAAGNMPTIASYAPAPLPMPEPVILDAVAVDPAKLEIPTISKVPYTIVSVGIITAIVTFVTAASAWLAALPCNVLGLGCGN